jgi:hypothetical protein
MGEFLTSAGKFRNSGNIECSANNYLKEGSANQS